jgi:citrate synthase
MAIPRGPADASGRIDRARGGRPRDANLRKAGTELLHDLPNLDFGLAAITRAFRLPDQAPVLLFALGRTIGWIAHAIEEYASGHLIRPRARYTGPMP